MSAPNQAKDETTPPAPPKPVIEKRRVTTQRPISQFIFEDWAQI